MALVGSSPSVASVSKQTLTYNQRASDFSVGVKVGDERDDMVVESRRGRRPASRPGRGRPLHQLPERLLLERDFCVMCYEIKVKSECVWHSPRAPRAHAWQGRNIGPKHQRNHDAPIGTSNTTGNSCEQDSAHQIASNRRWQSSFAMLLTYSYVDFYTLSKKNSDWHHIRIIWHYLHLVYTKGKRKR